MEEKAGIIEVLKRITTRELWAELGRRLDVKYGKIQMAFHGGRPSDYAELDVRVNIAESRSSVCPRDIETR